MKGSANVKANDEKDQGLIIIVRLGGTETRVPYELMPVNLE